MIVVNSGAQQVQRFWIDRIRMMVGKAAINLSKQDLVVTGQCCCQRFGQGPVAPLPQSQITVWPSRPVISPAAAVIASR